MTLDADLDSFDEAAFTDALADVYGVPSTYISLGVSAGSIVVDVLLTLPSSAGGSSADAESLSDVALSRMALINTTALSTLLNVTVTASASPVLEEKTAVVTTQLQSIRQVCCKLPQPSITLSHLPSPSLRSSVSTGTGALRAW